MHASPTRRNPVLSRIFDSAPSLLMTVADLFGQYNQVNGCRTVPFGIGAFHWCFYGLAACKTVTDQRRASISFLFKYCLVTY
jgi:hypothetical protein